MKRLPILLLIFTCNADNTNLFDQAYKVGQQNQFDLKLNQNSNINSYSQANKFESGVANNANAGNANAQSMFNNIYGDKATPNYLYNEGIKEIAICQTKSDPRCAILNKYGDKDTQTQMQAYNQGISAKYYLSIKPDPTNSACSNITRKVPINQTSVTCIAATHTQNMCNATILTSLDYHDCDPSKGECDSYQHSPDCKIVRPFIPSSCHYDCDSSFRGTSSAYCPYWKNAYGHDANWVSGTCNIGDTYYCSGVSKTVTCGNTTGDKSPNWHVDFSGCTPSQLATYGCKIYKYSDGCSGFKK